MHSPTAGSTTQTCGVADGVGANAQFSDPKGIAYDVNDGNLYVTDTQNCTIRQVNPATGSVVTFAGSPGACAFTDGLGSSAFFNLPAGIAFDAINGNLYLTDSSNNLIRQIQR